MFLNKLRAPIGATKNKKRLGRGESSGHGKTSGRGHKGQKARSGGYHKVGFEGGQMPLVRRLPKRGFTNIFRKTWAVINVSDIAKLQAKNVTELDLASLQKNCLAKKRHTGVRVLGNGEISFAVTIKANHFSKSAQEKIEKAGGKIVAA